LFGTTSTSWKFTWSNLFGTTYDSVYVEKDTTLYGIAYKKLVKRSSNHYPGGLIREDLNNGLVYYRALNTDGDNNPNDTIETIIFRYDLNIGDTFNINNVSFNGIGGRYVDTVDNVQVIDGRKYIYFKSKLYDKEPYTIIEGIGSNLGVILRKVNTVMQAQYLLCSYKDGVQTSFNNKRYNGNCSPPLSIRNTEITSKISIYPNPSIDKITISNHSGKKMSSGILYATDGHIVATLKSDFESIDVSALPSGLYFMRLAFENDETIIKPFSVAK
jgi:hypothetical protein